MIYSGGAPGGPFEDPMWYLDDPDYNADIADATVAFFEEYLTHTIGRWNREPFKLFPWQEHRIIRPLYGILRKQPCDSYPIGLRRYKKGYCEIPKKNGKSEIVAGMGIKALLFDHENNPVVHSAACDKTQAAIIHDVAIDMVKNNEWLMAHAKIIRSKKRIIGKTDSGIPNGYFSALSADVQNKHGANIYAVLFDELHAQPNSDLWDVLTEGSTVAREQPLKFAITTAGYDRTSICWTLREYAVRLLVGDPTLKDNTFLPVIYGMDEDEDWKNEDNWKAVNPSLFWMNDSPEGKVPSHDGVFDLETFREEYNEAQELPYKQNTWRRLRCNQWTQQETAFIPMDKYDALNAPFTDAELELLKGRQCYGGDDLSFRNDLTASALVFPVDDIADEDFWVQWKYFIPEKCMTEKIRKDRVPYDVWKRDGWVATNPGDTIDYNYVETAHDVWLKEYSINEIGFDPYNAMQYVNNMTAAGFEMIMIQQTPRELSPVTKELLRLILIGKIRFGGNPVSRSHAANTMVIEDNMGNIKPTKDKGRLKIDGMIAMICALSCAIKHKGEHGPSVYETSSVM